MAHVSGCQESVRENNKVHLKKHIYMSPSIEVDTALTIPTISSNAGKYKKLIMQRSGGVGSERLDTKAS